MELKLDEDIVLVTGSSKGIGRGIAEGFLKEGAHVIVNGREESALLEAVQSFESDFNSNRVHSFKGDLRKIPDLDSLSRFITNQWGRLDHLVCNIGSGQSVPVLEEDVGEFERMLEINLLTAVGVVQTMLPLMEKSAAEKHTSASITFIGSICGIEAIGCPVAYASSKAALEAYAKNICRPLGQKGIRVNILSPGNILFPGSTWEKKIARDSDSVRNMLAIEVPLNRFGTVAEVAEVAVFLASRCCGFVTGAHWVVDGGQTRSL